MTVESTGWGGLVPAGTVCPGGAVLWTIGYRNVIAGGASSTFTSATAGSKSFSVRVGGASGVLVPSGAAGTFQGMSCLRVTVK